VSRSLLLLLVLFLSGCAAMAKIEPGEVKLGEAMTATPDSAWNRLAIGTPKNTEVWTSDGLPLDRLVFYVGIADGEPLAPLRERSDRQIPKFRAAMPAHEIVEMYEVFASYDGSTFQRGKLAPAQFASSEGFRFEFARVRKGDELDMRGVAYAAVRGGKLYMLVFEAARTHYYGKHLARAEAVARSVRIGR
jgi:hypothetical protein